MNCRIPSPAIAALNGSSLFFAEGSPFVSHWQILNSVGKGFRYRRAIAPAVKRDLLAFPATRSAPVYLNLYQVRPIVMFPRTLADAWLEAGGRKWIIAELEARAGDRVVAFPGRVRR